MPQRSTADLAVVGMEAVYSTILLGFGKPAHIMHVQVICCMSQTGQHEPLEGLCSPTWDIC